MPSSELVVEAGALLCVEVGDGLEVDEGEVVDVWNVFGVVLLSDVAVFEGGEDEGSVSCAKEEEGRMAERKRIAGESWRDREQWQVVLLLEAMV